MYNVTNFGFVLIALYSICEYFIFALDGVALHTWRFSVTGQSLYIILYPCFFHISIFACVRIALNSPDVPLIIILSSVFCCGTYIETSAHVI